MGQRPKQDESSEPMFHATVRYKLWVKEQQKKRGWTLRYFAEVVTRCGHSITSGGLIDFLGKKNETPVASNTTLMPAINKALGAPPPPICDPTDPVERLKDRISASWPKASDTTKRMLLAGFEVPGEEEALLLAEGTLIAKRKP